MDHDRRKYEQNDNNNTTKCSQGNGGAAAVVCSEVGLNVPKGNFIINYLPHHVVLDEGEGLEDVGSVSAANSQEISIYFNKYLFGRNKYFSAYFWAENKYILA